MKTKTKLIISFIVMIFLLLFISLAALNNFTIVSGKLDEIYKDRYQKLMIAYDLRGEVNDFAKGLVNVLTVPTQATLNKNEELLTNTPARAEKLFAQLDGLAVTDAEESIIRELKRETAGYLAYGSQVVDLIHAGKASEAINLREREGLAYQENTINLIDDLTAFHRKAMDTAVAEAAAANQNNRMIMINTSVIGLVIGFGTMLWNLTGVTRGLNTLTTLIGGYARGTLDRTFRQKTGRMKDEFGEIAKAFYALADDLDRKTQIELTYNKKIEDESWVKSNTASLALLLQTEQELGQISQTFIEQMAPLVGACYACLYVREGLGDDKSLKLQGAYAPQDTRMFEQQFVIGEGLVGQCARSKQIIELTELPPSYIKLRSGIGETAPSHLMLFPVLYQNRLLAVIELAGIQPFDERQRALLTELAESCGITLNNLFGRIRIEELLRESQALGEELQVQSEELISQQEELRNTNERLEEQTRALRSSEELLQSQQEELEQSNEELLKKAHLLELQIKQTEKKNEQIEKTKQALEKQTVQLALSSKYKSEFLANMSHELRTPLNSLLILSQMLKDNKDGNLTSKQLEFATTIHSSGGDLLKLIDEILDLSKIGAGKMNLVTENVPVAEMLDNLKRSFAPLGQQKGIAFTTMIEPGVPKDIYTDSHRVKQVLKNLLSNAFKFTHQGEISVTIRAAEHELDQDELSSITGKGSVIAFDVRDTGIGIPEDKQQMIFEAFQQVDGTTSRIYGGTGLGLAISRELSGLLGGTLTLQSTEGVGSIFTLYLPEFYVGDLSVAEGAENTIENREPVPNAFNSVTIQSALQSVSAAAAEMNPIAVEDDREAIGAGDRVVLIIEDDINFARVLLDMARSRGFKGIVALQGDRGLDDARTFLPDAILLDIMLPVMDGWSVLHHLKHDADTRHIPVHVISVMEDIQQGLSMGAIAYLRKPATKERLDSLFQQIESFLDRDLKRLLIVEDDAVQRISITELIGHDDVIIKGVSSGREALEELNIQHYDCMVLDLGLPDINGFDLLDSIRKNENLRSLPIIIYTGRDLDKKEERELKKYAETIIIKDVKSPERLLDETTLFLHRVVADLPEEKRSVLRKLHSVETIFEGKPILIVDDDIRNVFALSSALEGYNMHIHFAENGRESLEMLEKHPDIQLVLMDMMMPEMDGYEAMRRIRSIPKHEQLPIIAITAKAMKEDREKCIEAGASDYIAKPVNIDQLLSLMRVWLYK
ncbi:response regulator [Paenibacillus solisilvae]|uniref:histidine kinase n=1 Tax=Paenibacillus solisilvae TaxID=2486751 RepID=A0ABW0W4S8_9BACL